MTAGRELDALVAEKVMGCCTCGCEDDHPPYSTDIVAAYIVLEQLRKDEIYFEITADKGGYYISGYNGYDASRYSNCDGGGDTLALAICLAALKAVGFEP